MQMEAKIKQDAILPLDKINVKPKTNKRQRNHYIMVNRSVHQDDVTVAHIYTPDIGTPK